MFNTAFANKQNLTWTCAESNAFESLQRGRVGYLGCLPYQWNNYSLNSETKILNTNDPTIFDSQLTAVNEGGGVQTVL